MFQRILLLILLPLMVFSQSEIDGIQAQRKSFVSIKKLGIKNPSADFVIIDNDTLISINKNALNLNNFETGTDKQNTFLLKYLKSVFYYSNEKSKEVYYLIQWNTPIIVYLDKSIPTEVANNFKSFFLSLNSIPNLTITFSKNIKNSNYLIRVSDKKFSFSNQLYKFRSIEEQNKFAFNNGDYFPVTDGNNKIYTCILEINLEHILDNATLESNLKQLFFLSLGRFFLDIKNKDPKSLLNYKYLGQNEILDDDIELLKFHYQNIYPQKVNGTTFSQLLKSANSN